MIDYLKVGKATELEGWDRRFYRFIEIFVGSMSWLTLIFLVVFSYFKPVWIAYFIIIFDIYWLLLVLYLAVHLIIASRRMQKNRKVKWMEKCVDLAKVDIKDIKDIGDKSLAKKGMKYYDVKHFILMPTYGEGVEIVANSILSIVESSFSSKEIVFVLGLEEREGESAPIKGAILKERFGDKFKDFLIITHPDNIVGELKGKGANQAWMAKELKRDYIDKQDIPYENILVSVFDCDTVVYSEYFSCLTYKFLTVNSPYRASYQPVPLYHNNVWSVSFFSRVAASSNTFWQMMQQIRIEKLATYSSHSMTWKALIDIGFWSKTMVSEDSRIFWHCLFYYNGDYRVEPLYYPVSMDSIEAGSTWGSLKGLYKQQQRWGWGVENVPYVVFNTVKKWDQLPKTKMIDKIFVQLHGFHSWATNALIIAVIGWMPLILGGDRFNDTVLSGNLPNVTRYLMMFAMSGLVLSSIVSTILLPKRPKKYSIFKNIIMLFEWILLPLGIIIFGSIPALDAQTHMLFGKYLGFSVTPKQRSEKGIAKKK